MKQHENPKLIEFKWCPECVGLIHRAARWCRFCHRNISEKEEELVTRFRKPGDSTRKAREWMLGFDQAIENLPPSSIKARLEEGVQDEVNQCISCGFTSEEAAKNHLVDAAASVDVLHDAPGRSIRALLVEILITMANCGQRWKPLCDQPRMRVLGIDEDLVESELKARAQEQDDNVGLRACPYCSENNLKNAEKCRSCGSNFSQPPQREKAKRYRGLLREFEPSYLREVLLFLAANEAQVNSRWGESFREVLLNSEIKEEEVDAELKKRKYAQSEGIVISPPLSAFRKQLLAEGLAGELWSYYLNQDLRSLAKQCQSDHKNTEAELVLKYAIALAGDEDPRQPMGACSMRECLKDLSLLYEKMGRYEDARALLQDATKRRKSTPATGDLKAVLDLFGGGEDLLTLQKEARICAKQGNYQAVDELYEKAMPLLSSDDGLVLLTRDTVFTTFAELYVDAYKFEKAENVARQALACITEDSGSVLYSIFKLRILDFLAQALTGQGKLQEAEAVCQQLIQCSESSGSKSNGLRELAGVYLAQQRYEEADSLLQNTLSQAEEQKSKAPNRGERCWGEMGVMSDCLTLAELCRVTDKIVDSDSYLHRGLETIEAGIREGIPPGLAGHWVKLMQKYCEALARLGNQEKSEEMAKQMEPLRSLALDFLF